MELDSAFIIAGTDAVVTIHDRSNNIPVNGVGQGRQGPWMRTNFGLGDYRNFEAM
jgi:hypothetical protein